MVALHVSVDSPPCHGVLWVSGSLANSPASFPHPYVSAVGELLPRAFSDSNMVPFSVVGCLIHTIVRFPLSVRKRIFPTAHMS